MEYKQNTVGFANRKLQKEKKARQTAFWRSPLWKLRSINNTKKEKKKIKNSMIIMPNNLIRKKHNKRKA